MSEKTNILNGLEPVAPLGFFEEISRIPRPSYHEEKISAYLENFAIERNLEYYKDDLGNVIIIKEASKGMEGADTIILQGHMDMVCEKEEGCTKNMEKEGLDLEVNGDLISARGTTLGGDDGVALCIALAILDDDKLPHPRLECVFTVSEETGMEGANAIDVSMLKGRKLINIDSEDEKYIIVGCAGGARIHLTLPVERTGAYDRCLEVMVGGLKGGHSGTEIDKGRANAALVLADVLQAAAKADKSLTLIALAGGSKDNAIPALAKAVVSCSNEDAVRDAVSRAAGQAAEEFKDTDPGLKVEVVNAEVAGDIQPLTREKTEDILDIMSTSLRGVIRMTPDIPDLVQTSLNMGISDLLDGEMDIHFSIRSSVASEKENLAESLKAQADKYGFEYERTGDYPAWERVPESALSDVIRKTYNEVTGKDIGITVIHAGLECGLLADKLPGLDAVSIGPDIYDIHTPAERMSVSSMQRMYEVIRRVISGGCES